MVRPIARTQGSAVPGNLGLPGGH